MLLKNLMGHVNVLGKHMLNLTLQFSYWKVTSEKWFPSLGISLQDARWVIFLLLSKSITRSSVIGMSTRQPPTSQSKVEIKEKMP